MPRCNSSNRGGGNASTSSLKWLLLYPLQGNIIPNKSSLESSLNLKRNTAYTQEQRRPLQLVVEDLIGVIIYHVNRKVFLN